MAANDPPSVKVFDEYIEELEAALQSFGFNCKLKGKMWWQRSPKPLTCSKFLEIVVSFQLLSGKTPADLERAFMPNLAGSARTYDTCVRFCHEPTPPFQSAAVPAFTPPNICRVIVVAPSPESVHSDKQRIHLSLQRLAGEAVKNGILVHPNYIFSALSEFEPPQYGLVPWTLCHIDFLARCPADTLHVGSSGLMKYVRGFILDLVGGQQRDPGSGRTGAYLGKEALHNLHQSILTGLSFSDGVQEFRGMGKQGFLKLGKLDGKASLALHKHLTAALGAADVIFDPVLRQDVLLTLQLLSLTLRLALHAPAHPDSDPGAFSARIAKLRATAKSTVLALTSTFAAYQVSDFDLSKVHALLEIAHWCESFVSLAWVSMDLPESFHRQLKPMISGRTNGRNYEHQVLDTYLCKVALFQYLPRLRAQGDPPTEPLPACLPLPRLATWPWSKFNEGAPPPISLAEYAAAWPLLLSSSPPPYTSITWYHKAHLSRANGPIVLADVTFDTVHFVVRLCERAGGTPVYPFAAEGLRGCDPNDFEKKCPLYHPVAFFAATHAGAGGGPGGRQVDVFVVAKRYLEHTDGSPEASQYPYILSSRRTLGVQLCVFPLSWVFGACVVSYFSASSAAKKSLHDVSFSLWENSPAI